MHTRETALAHLRKHGTLMSGAQADNRITKLQASDGLARKVIDVIHSNRGRSDARMLAPHFLQSVLP